MQWKIKLFVFYIVFFFSFLLMLKSKTMNNLFWIKVMFYDKLLYIYIKYVNLKRYTGIDWYQNISFHWLNQYSLRYEIDSLAHVAYLNLIFVYIVSYQNKFNYLPAQNKLKDKFKAKHRVWINIFLSRLLFYY